MDTVTQHSVIVSIYKKRGDLIVLKMLNRYVEQAMKTFPHVDSIMVVDMDGVIRYYYTVHPEISAINSRDIIGRALLEAYPSLDKASSYIIKCLATGQSYLNYDQTFTSYQGRTLRTISSTVPIHDGEKMVAVADFCIYLKQGEAETNGLIIRAEESTLQSVSVEQESLNRIIGSSASMKALKQSIMDSYDSDASVLVYGKTGTGKELIVRAIHENSARHKGPFVVQNCAAIPATLLESLLFGTAKGSYTGAIDNPGLFQMAHGGTLFLDEINSMELEAQAKILRAIEEKKVRRLGSSKQEAVDVRIIAAMNEEPLECMAAGKIRKDLYYRLSVIRYDLAELKERQEDIPLLMDYFMQEFNKSLRRNLTGYTPEVMRLFMTYDWPGNVRELRNAVEAACQFNFSNQIHLHDIPQHMLNQMAGPHLTTEELQDRPLDEIVAEFEKKLIAMKYAQCGKNLTKTAEMFHVSKQTLWYRMKKYGI